MCRLNLKYELLEYWICRNLVFSHGKYILLIVNITYHKRLFFFLFKKNPLKLENKLLSFKSLIERWHKVLEHYVISFTYFSCYYYMAFKSECCFLIQFQIWFLSWFCCFMILMKFYIDFFLLSSRWLHPSVLYCLIL